MKYIYANVATDGSAIEAWSAIVIEDGLGHEAAAKAVATRIHDGSRTDLHTRIYENVGRVRIAVAPALDRNLGVLSSVRISSVRFYDIIRPECPEPQVVLVGSN